MFKHQCVSTCRFRSELIKLWRFVSFSLWQSGSESETNVSKQQRCDDVTDAAAQPSRDLRRRSSSSISDSDGRVAHAPAAAAAPPPPPPPPRRVAVAAAPAAAAPVFNPADVTSRDRRQSAAAPPAAATDAQRSTSRDSTTSSEPPDGDHMVSAWLRDEQCVLSTGTGDCRKHRPLSSSEESRSEKSLSAESVESVEGKRPRDHRWR